MTTIDYFDGDDGDPWDATLWPLIRYPRDPAETPEIQTGRGRLEVLNTSGSRVFCFTEPELADVDISFKFLANPDDNVVYLELGYRITHGIASDDPGNGYTVILQPSGDNVRLCTINDDDARVIAGAGNANFAGISSATTEYSVRVRSQGDRHQVKWWAASNPEPSSWQFDITDATWSAAGRIYIALAALEANPTYVDIDRFRFEEIVPAPAGTRVGSERRPIVGLYIGATPVVFCSVGDVEIPVPESEPPPPPSGLDGFPTSTTVGVFAANPGWVPDDTITDDMFVTDPGEIVENLRFEDCALVVEAISTTVRNCEFVNAGITNISGTTVYGNLIVEDCTFTVDNGDYLPTQSALYGGGYTVRRCAIIDVNEGFSVESPAGSGWDVVIEDTWCRIHPPDDCTDWHGDGLQTLGDVPEGEITFTNSVIGAVPLIPEDDCGASSAIDLYHTNMAHGVINGLILFGGGFSLRQGAPTDVNGLYIVEDSYYFDVMACDPDTIGDWNDAWLCALDEDGQPIDLVELERPT